MRRWLGVISLFLFSISPLSAYTPDGKFVHGLALHGDPKYPSTFTHFDYVNPDAPKGGHIKLAGFGTYDSFNPFVIKGTPVAGIGGLGGSLFYASLLEPSYDEPMSYYAYIAESVAVTRDAVIFNLRPEATFHDGSPITPEDVIFTFNTLVEKGLPLFKQYYEDVVSVEKTGERQVTFTLDTKTMNRELPLIVGQLPILSKTYYETHDFEDASLKMPLGSGPYKIKSFDAGNTITFERVKDWWGNNLPVARGHHNFDKQTYIYFRDLTVMFEAFKGGEYDFRMETTAKNWAVGYTFPAVKQGRLKLEEIKHDINQGMNGFAFNTRRALFKDRRVREALAWIYNFEWDNENLFYGSYTRTNSFFENSDLAARGLPQGEELEILKAYKDKLRPEVFTKEFRMPVYQSRTDLRIGFKKAQDLLKEAGWIIQRGKLVHEKTKQPFRFQVLIFDPALERAIQGFIRNLRRLGIEANIRVVDTAQYTARFEDFDFDMLVAGLPQSLSPGNEQAYYWGSESAHRKGSQNVAGIQDPVIDALIEKVVAAPDRESLINRTRALDRVLLWDFYVIPRYHSETFRLAYWDKFLRPPIVPKYSIGLDTWWAK